MRGYRVDVGFIEEGWVKPIYSSNKRAGGVIIPPEASIFNDGRERRR